VRFDIEMNSPYKRKP